MSELILVGRRSPGQRCAYCHGPLGAERVATCTGCQVTLHAGCRAELPACPTPGCGGDPGVAPRPPAPRLSPAVERALDAAHESALERRRSEGRAARAYRWPGPPPWAARLGLYGRLAAGGVCAAFLTLMQVSLLVPLSLVLLRPQDLPTSDRGVLPLAFLLWLAMAGGGLLSLRWLRRVWRVWRAVGPLLDLTRPTPMQLTVRRDTFGRERRLRVSLVGAGTQLELEGQFPLVPGWLAGCSGQEVLVYGLPPPGPYLIELTDGRLALVDLDA